MRKDDEKNIDARPKEGGLRLTRRDFLKRVAAGLVSLGAVALLKKIGKASNSNVLGKRESREVAGKREPLVPVSLEFLVDDRLRAKKELTQILLNEDLPNKEELLNKVWWLASYTAWLRTHNKKDISFDNYLGLVQDVQRSGGNASEIMFQVGGTDKRISPYNSLVLKVNPLEGGRIVVVDDGVYSGQFLGMRLDITQGDFAPDDKHGQSRITETTYKQFGFTKDIDGQFVILFSWDPSELSKKAKSVQLTERWADALVLMAFRAASVHNMNRLPGSSEEEIFFLDKYKVPFNSLLFGIDKSGDPIGLLTAPEFDK